MSQTQHLISYIELMERAILAFAEGQSWAAQPWKELPHIATLFEIAEAIKTTQKQENRT